MRIDVPSAIAAAASTRRMRPMQSLHAGRPPARPARGTIESSPTPLACFHPRTSDTMHFDYTPKVQDLRTRLLAFMDEHIYPNEKRHEEEAEQSRQNARNGGSYTTLPLM